MIIISDKELVSQKNKKEGNNIFISRCTFVTSNKDDPGVVSISSNTVGWW